jgi:anti-sigma factor RsiW
MSTCDRLEELRDYAVGELPANARSEIAKHAAVCAECASELNSLRFTAAALRALPDEEIPRRIGFVSDKVFEPSPVARWLQSFWNSAARLGFASACLLAVAITTFALRQPSAAVAMPLVSISADVTNQIDAAVTKAVAEVRLQDAQLTRAALDAAEVRHQQEHQALMVAMQESMTVLQKRLSMFTMLASNSVPREDAGQ